MSVGEQWEVIDELAARQGENDVTIAAHSGE
jgi:hypothetical protein